MPPDGNPRGQGDELEPMVVINAGDHLARRYNELLKIVKQQGRQIRRLEQQAGRCECMNCVVIGI